MYVAEGEEVAVAHFHRVVDVVYSSISGRTESKRDVEIAFIVRNAWKVVAT